MVVTQNDRPRSYAQVERVEYLALTTNIVKIIIFQEHYYAERKAIDGASFNCSGGNPM